MLGGDDYNLIMYIKSTGAHTLSETRETVHAVAFKTNVLATNPP